MPNPLAVSDVPDLVDRKVGRIYIKDGKRKLMSSDGVMFADAKEARKAFGRFKGGRYGLPQ